MCQCVCVCVSTHCSWSCNYPSFFGTILTTSLNGWRGAFKDPTPVSFPDPNCMLPSCCCCCSCSACCWWNETSSFVAQFDRASSHFNKTLFSCDEIFNAPSMCSSGHNHYRKATESDDACCIFFYLLPHAQPTSACY